MYQYIARLESTKEVIYEGHTIQEVENHCLTYRRQQKKGSHTNMNIPIEIIHVKRDQLTGLKKEEVLKKI